MRGLGLVIAGVVIGLCAIAQAETPQSGLVMQKLDGDRIVTIKVA